MVVYLSAALSIPEGLNQQDLPVRKCGALRCPDFPHHRSGAMEQCVNELDMVNVDFCSSTTIFSMVCVEIANVGIVVHYSTHFLS